MASRPKLLSMSRSLRPEEREGSDDTARGHARKAASSYEVTTHCSGPGRPAGDAKASGRRVTSKAPSLAHVEGGSGRSEASPTAILQDIHSVEGLFCELRLNGVHLEFGRAQTL